nr:hypothetical protein [Microctonus hyperodae filamentous virus]
MEEGTNFIKTLIKYTKTTELEILESIKYDIQTTAMRFHPLMGTLFDSATFSLKHNFLHISNVSIREIVQFWKRGEFTKIFTKLHFDTSTLDKFSDILHLEVQHLPAYKINKIEMAANSLVAKFPLLENVKDERIAHDIIRNNYSSKWKQLINFLLNNRKKLFGYTLAIGVPTVGLEAFFAKYAREISGCMRYEVMGETLKVCKVRNCSCFDKELTGNFTTKLIYCKTNILPDIMQNVDCDETTSKTRCIHCNSQENDPHVENINIEFKCISYDILGAIGDFFSTKTTDLLHHLDTIQDNVFDSVNSGIYLLKILTWALGIFVLFFGIFKLFQKYNNKNSQQQQQHHQHGN